MNYTRGIQSLTHRLNVACRAIAFSLTGTPWGRKFGSRGAMAINMVTLHPRNSQTLSLAPPVTARPHLFSRIWISTKTHLLPPQRAKQCPFFPLTWLGPGHASFLPAGPSYAPSHYRAKPVPFSCRAKQCPLFPHGAGLQLDCPMPCSAWLEVPIMLAQVLDWDHQWNPTHKQTGHCPSGLSGKKVLHPKLY